MTSQNLQLYLTAESPCSYYDDRTSSNLVPDPKLQLTMSSYSLLIQHGFRRSGSHCYRPYCQSCFANDRVNETSPDTAVDPHQQACIACRLPAHKYAANRSQKRCLKTNQDLKLIVANADFTDEYFELYRRYLNSRHGDGSMANPDEQDFKQFLYCDWSDTLFLEFRLHGKLLAVAVCDIVSNGLSAVYSFFEPDMAQRGLGSYCIIRQIEYIKERGLDYLYLGYWIKNHPKMHYKSNFKPLQLYLDEQWQTKQDIWQPGYSPEI